MGKKLTQSESTSKTQQNQQFSNTFDWLKQPDNKYFGKAESFIDGYDGGAGAVREAHGRNANDIANSGNSIMGPDDPAYVTEGIKSNRFFKNNLDLGRGLSDAKQNEMAYKQSGYTTLGQLTAPQLVQTGGTSSGTMTGQGTGYNPLLGQLGGSFAQQLGGGAAGGLAM